MCKRCDARRAELLEANPQLVAVDKAIDEMVALGREYRYVKHTEEGQAEFDEKSIVIQKKYGLSDDSMIGVMAVAMYELGLLSAEQCQIALALAGYMRIAKTANLN